MLWLCEHSHTHPLPCTCKRDLYTQPQPPVTFASLVWMYTCGLWLFTQPLCTLVAVYTCVHHKCTQPDLWLPHCDTHATVTHTAACLHGHMWLATSVHGHMWLGCMRTQAKVRLQPHVAVAVCGHTHVAVAVYTFATCGCGCMRTQTCGRGCVHFCHMWLYVDTATCGKSVATCGKSPHFSHMWQKSA